MLQQFRSGAKWVWIILIFAFGGGFLLVESSGLLGRSPITPGTAVASVNGTDILYTDFVNRYQSEIQNQQQQSGRTLTEDEIRAIQNNVFDQMVDDVLLQQEYQRRNIIVTDDEIRDYARFAPPPWIMQSPELQTEGQFDVAKYQRYLASPQARQSGLNAMLEQYYRTQIPQQKLVEQITSGVYVSDPELWRIWQDGHDSAQVAFVAFRPDADSALAAAITDAELQQYFDAHREEYRRPGSAKLSVVEIPRLVTAADSAAVRAHAVALRNEILGGAKFEDVARRESADTISGAQGGDLGRGARGRFIPEFEEAAYALRPGQISQPVLTQFGYHLIRVDERKGDTLALRHILLRIQPSDSTTARVDRKADDLARIAASSEQGSRLDSAATQLGLTIEHVVAQEDQPAVYQGRVVPSVSAWAFGGARVGETSDLFSTENGYYLARLDSIQDGGEPNLDNVKAEVRQAVLLQKQLDQLMPRATELAQAAAASGSLESAAAGKNLDVVHTGTFTRGTLVPGLGRFNRAVGTAFGLPVGAVSKPVQTTDAVVVLRVAKRVSADSSAFVDQEPILRQQRLQQLRQQKVQMFMDDLRKAARIDDNRKDINAMTQRAEV